jgi:hypothetical protein
VTKEEVLHTLQHSEEEMSEQQRWKRERTVYEKQLMTTLLCGKDKRYQKVTAIAFILKIS